MKNAFYLVFISLFALSCSVQETVDPKKEAETLMEISRQWAKSATAEEFLSYWNDKSLFMEPGKALVKGRTNIAKALEATSTIPEFRITWEPQEASVSASGDMGYTIDKILVTYNDQDGKQVKLFEKGVTIWERQADKSWKNVVDIWNTDPSLTSIY